MARLTARRLRAARLIAAMGVAAYALTGTADGGLGPASAYAKNDKAQGAGAEVGKPEGKGKPADAGRSASDDETVEERIEDEIVDEVLDGVFGEDEREIIETYARERGVRTSSLPPGIAKNVQRGKPLPPGIAKRGLPQDLESRLPPLREGLERIIVGDDVTIVEEGTRIVVDVLKDVLTGQ